MKKWSISAHNCFVSCQRKYFFRYIMAHHNAKDTLRREAYLVSQLSSLDAWKGKLVHSALETYFTPSLQDNNLISYIELTQKTLDLGKKQLEFSQQKRYREAGITKTKAGEKYLALKIHETEKSIKSEAIEKVFNEIKECYQNLYNYQKFIDFLLNQASWCETEFRLSFKLDGVTITGQPDLLVGYGDRKICVIDWKTGKNPNSDYSNQLRIYGLSVVNSSRWSAYDLSDLLLLEASLFQDKFNKMYLEKIHKLAIETFISNSISDIKTVTGDRKYSLDDLKNYSYAKNTNYCKYCSFESICQELP